MSSIATKPSTGWTWSPSRASVQKRHSSGSEDPLLRDGAAANANQLADRCVDEPGRVVVAVPAPRPVDENEVVATDLRAPPTQARLAPRSAQSRAPRLLERRRNAVQRLRRRAGP